MTVNSCPIVVLIGGNGSNLQAIIDHQKLGAHYHIAGVVSHRPDAYGLVRASQANIPTTVVDHREFTQRESFDQQLYAAITTYSPKLIVMAGFMRILSPWFIAQFPSQIVNIHPSLLPKWKGLNTHQRVLEAGESEHGVSVHFVTNELDGGPIIAQVKVMVQPGDTVDSLSKRTFIAEHWLYPQIIDWFAQDRLKYLSNIVTLDDKTVGPQGLNLVLPTEQGIVS